MLRAAAPGAGNTATPNEDVAAYVDLRQPALSVMPGGQHQAIRLFRSRTPADILVDDRRTPEAYPDCLGLEISQIRGSAVQYVRAEADRDADCTS